MKILNKPGKANERLGKWMRRLVDSHESCKYCNTKKKDYIDPETGKLTPLLCDCEKQFVNLLEAKKGIEKSRFSVLEKNGNNEAKLSVEERQYMIESEKTIDKLDETIEKMRKIAYENKVRNYEASR